MINALEQDADLEQAVQAAGGVTALINMASKHDDSPLVQAQFAGVLRDLCISDEIALEIHQAGGPPNPNPNPTSNPNPNPTRSTGAPVALTLPRTLTLTLPLTLTQLALLGHR